MHEMSLAESMLQLVEETAHREQAKCVKTILIEIGQLACVEPEALKFCFEAVSRRTMAEGSRLEIVSVAGTAHCPRCQCVVPLETLYDACPLCGLQPLPPLSGTEMRVREIEIV